MLQVITSITQDIVDLIKDDPVRPEIPVSDRVNANSRIYILKDGDQTQAITCVKFLNSIPTGVADLGVADQCQTCAVFYTIWSYTGGAGRRLIQQAQQAIAQEFPSVNTYVTLSPKTEMARQFHLRNGAGIYRENIDTINYIYK